MQVPLGQLLNELGSDKYNTLYLTAKFPKADAELTVVFYPVSAHGPVSDGKQTVHSLLFPIT